jgi:hypothetical protein
VSLAVNFLAPPVNRPRGSAPARNEARPRRR